MKILTYGIIILVALILIKVIWVWSACRDTGSWDTEKSDILNRSDFLTKRIITDPLQLLNRMPKFVGPQFQGEWALYSCSMLAKALSNIALIYTEKREECLQKIDSLISIVLSPELRRYDAVRWGEDPLETLDGPNSHISYLSHLAWMIGNYKLIGGSDKYDEIYEQVCSTMNRRINDSSSLNLPTYPGEPVYLPDMFVAIVALNDYASANNGKYADTVSDWMLHTREELVDPKTGLIASILNDDHITGSYSALNCYYLSLIDYDFGKLQYDRLKLTFYRGGMLAGIKEFTNRSPLLAANIDAGIILFGLSPSGTAFAIGPATVYGDKATRKELLRTAEIVGHTIGGKDRHYLLGNLALVGEAITLAMRTSQNTSHRE